MKKLLGRCDIGQRVNMPLVRNRWVIDHEPNDEIRQFTPAIVLFKSENKSYYAPNSASVVSIAISKPLGYYFTLSQDDLEHRFTTAWASHPKILEEYPYYVDISGDINCSVMKNIVDDKNMCKQCNNPLIHSTKKNCPNCLVISKLLKII